MTAIPSEPVLPGMEAATLKGADDRPIRLKGLDSIRFICAFIVLIGHYFSAVAQSLFGDTSHGFARIAQALFGCFINGPAAVVIFFIISGFCIHFPHRHGKPLNLKSFYARRLIRIGLPALLAILLAVSVNYSLRLFTDGVFWSVICEIVYYLIYPLLLRLNQRCGWKTLILVSYAAALLLSLASLESIRQTHGGYASFGLWNWVVGLPCWLLGCWLAENFERFPVLTFRRIWLIRAALLFVGAVQIQVRWHSGSVFGGGPFTLNLLSPLACLWLGLEIAYFRTQRPWAWLEQAGLWSYSLYLIHPMVPNAMGRFFREALEPIQFYTGPLLIGAALGLSWLFYRLAEKPAHALAVKVSLALKH